MGIRAFLSLGEFISRTNRVLQDELGAPAESCIFPCPTASHPGDWDYQGALELRELAMEAAKRVQRDKAVR